MVVTEKQYSELEVMLNEIGVEIRKTRFSGGNISIQVRNVYRDNCILRSILTGQEISDESKREIREIINGYLART